MACLNARENSFVKLSEIKPGAFHYFCQTIMYFDYSKTHLLFAYNPQIGELFWLKVAVRYKPKVWVDRKDVSANGFTLQEKSAYKVGAMDQLLNLIAAFFR